MTRSGNSAQCPALTAILVGMVIAALLPGCTLTREYTRRGLLLDSLAVRTVRIESRQNELAQELAVTRAEVSRQLNQTIDRLDAISARLEETENRLSRISLRLGLGRGNLTPTPAESDTPRLKQSQSVPVRRDSAPLPAGGSPDPVKMYDAAYYDFTRGKYEVAISGFEQFISQFPASDNADNARYWIGECYYSMNDLERARTEFARVLRDYPDGNKVPAATYKLGMVELGLGRRDEARRWFDEVIRKYPGTPEARLAEDKLLRLED